MPQLNQLFEDLDACIQNRQSENFVFEAEAIFAEIYQLGDTSCIVPLIGYLRDNDQPLEFGWSIVHLIEAFPSDVYLLGLLEAMPAFFTQAPDWAETLHARIFNSIPATMSYMKALAKSQPDQRQAILMIIARLASEKAEFERKAGPVKKLLEAIEAKAT